MIGCTLLIASPSYAWYAMLLVPLVAMSGRWEWMLVPLALSLHAVFAGNTFFRDSLVAAAVGIAIISLVRARHLPRWHRPRALTTDEPRPGTQ
jgi:hypothetical protein